MTQRLAPLAPAAWPAAMRDALGPLSPSNARHPAPERPADRPKGLNVLGLLAHHPELARAYNVFNGHLLYDSTLAPRQRELLVLRVAAQRAVEYEWLQHKVIARDLGMSPEEIERVAEGSGAEGWSELDAALLRAADSLLADASIPEETYEVLAGELGAQQLLDLVFTVGAYDLMAMAMRTFQVEVDDDLATWR